MRGGNNSTLYGGLSPKAKAEVAWSQGGAQFPFSCYNPGKGSLPTLGEAMALRPVIQGGSAHLCNPFLPYLTPGRH